MNIQEFATLVEYDIPVIMISSLGKGEAKEVIEALELGAFDYIQKPTVQDMHNLRSVLKESFSHAIEFYKNSERLQRNSKLEMDAHREAEIEFDTQIPIFIGSSTGGTDALKKLFSTFPKRIPPVLVVQHIPPLFSKALAERLNDQFPYLIKEAMSGDPLQENTILIAPGGRHMKVKESLEKKIVVLDNGPEVHRQKPSVDVLFESAAKVCSSQAIGVILTGMGKDGAAGLLKMRQEGAITIGQDEESSVVYGMPKAAFEIGAVEIQSPLDQIAMEISKQTLRRKNQQMKRKVG
ncbi:MAG: chemotaxis response regulator protein-glutamate methylesterase [Bdellovibrio sp.]|nr:MAG: chemotaxis response regulator protein-glutamate methylesterase [Bdellovibrio sp.]